MFDGRTDLTWGLMLVLALAGCFQPNIQDGQFACGEGQVCPPGFECNDQGVCVEDAVDVADAAVLAPDAAPIPDADPLAPDADPDLGRIPDPILLYLFDEPSGNIVRDSSGLSPALDLVIGQPLSVVRRPGTLELIGETIINRAEPPTRLIDALQQSEAFTVEAWVTPAETSVSGPRRIVTVSQDGSFGSIMLAQGGPTPDPLDERDVFALRLQTSDNLDPRGKPEIETELGTAVTALTHIAYTREANGDLCVYLNGVEVLPTQRTGDFDVWDPAHLLGIGNEHTGDRQWLGVMHLIAIYDRALDDPEIFQNFTIGPDPELR